MNTSLAIEKINKYLDYNAFNDKNFLADQSHCLFLNGPWGIGKSFLISNLMKTFAANNKEVKIGYFSLAGVSDIGELENSIGQWLFPRWSKIKRYLPSFDLGVALDFFNFSTNIGSSEYISRIVENVLKTRKQKYIIVFDELDRKCDSLDLNSVFALVTSLSSIKEEKGEYHRVILVNNDEAFKKPSDIEKIKSFRNKVSAVTIVLDEPDSDIINTQLKSLPNISGIPTLSANSNFNLRSNLKAINYYNEVKHLIKTDKEKESLFYILLNVANNEESLIYEFERKDKVERYRDVSKNGNAFLEKLYYVLDRWLRVYYNGPSSGFIYISIINKIYSRSQIDSLIYIIKHFLSGKTFDKEFKIPLPINDNDKSSIDYAIYIAQKVSDKTKHGFDQPLDGHLINAKTVDAWIIAITQLHIIGLDNYYYSSINNKMFNVLINDLPVMDGMILDIFGGVLNDGKVQYCVKKHLCDLMALERTNLIARNNSSFFAYEKDKR